MKMERWNENKALENATKRLLSNHAFIWRGKFGKRSLSHQLCVDIMFINTYGNHRSGKSLLLNKSLTTQWTNHPPLPTVVSAWEYKKRYTVEGWGGQRNSSKISSFTSQYYTCIYCSFVYRENFPSHFKFKEYCPLVFRQLRDRFGIDDSEYAVSGDAACVTCMFIYLLHYST